MPVGLLALEGKPALASLLRHCFIEERGVQPCYYWGEDYGKLVRVPHWALLTPLLVRRPLVTAGQGCSGFRSLRWYCPNSTGTVRA